MASILDRNFRYYPASDTDLRRTFRRIRREMVAPSSAPPDALPAVPSARVAVLPVRRRRAVSSS
jgi:hypothetical protein